MKAKIKIIIDTGMVILILLQMTYHLIDDSLHSWGGMIPRNIAVMPLQLMLNVFTLNIQRRELKCIDAGMEKGIRLFVREYL